MSRSLFSPVRRRRVYDEIAAQLRDAILDGRFTAGEKLPPERELAEEFGVNRTSIREAIKVLEGLRLVDVRQGSGAVVREVVDGSLELLGPMVFHGDRLDPEILADLFEVTMPMLIEMARLAVERHQPEQLHRLRDLRDGIADTDRPRDERFALQREILVLLSDMSRNRVWQMLARRTRDLFASTAFCEARERLRRDPGRVLPTLNACLDALEASDPQAAITAVEGIITALSESGLASGVDVSRPAATH